MAGAQMMSITCECMQEQQLACVSGLHNSSLVFAASKITIRAAGAPIQVCTQTIPFVMEASMLRSD